MKKHLWLTMAFVVLSLLVGESATAQATSSQSQTQSQSSEQSSSSSDGAVTKKTVTVTSDGNRTIKKTTIVRNGVEETTTEITDGKGNVTTTRNGDGKDGEEPAGKEGGAWLGVRVKEVSEALRAQLGLPKDQGVLIDVLALDGPAAGAGIQKGDLLLAISGVPISNPQDLVAALERLQPGAEIEVELMRRGQRQTVTVTLGARPGNRNPDGQPPALPDGGPGGGPQIEMEIEGGGFEQVLNDPNVPEDFKERVREMQRRMEEFQRKNQPGK